MRRGIGLVCAGSGEDFRFAHSIGVGLVESSISLTKFCLLHSPSSLIFFGSAGSYSADIGFLQTFYSKQCFQIESSYVLNHSYSPLRENLLGVSCETNTLESICKERLSLPKTKINSSNFICRNVKVGDWMRQRGIFLENMEFFSVLKVAKRFHIEAVGIFCVSNYCNKRAHEDFIKNQPEVRWNLENIFNSLEQELQSNSEYVFLS